MKEVFTIGHSNVNIEMLINSLNKNKIKILIDIRNKPYSKYCPQYNIHNLKKEIILNDIEYLWFPKLGGLEEWDKNSYIALEQSLLLAKNKKLCYICSERDENKCHRKSILQPEVEKRGFKVFHIDVLTGEIKKTEVKTNQISLLGRLNGRTLLFEGKDGGSTPRPAEY